MSVAMMVMVMAVTVAKQKRAHDVDDQADNRNERRRAELNLSRLQEPHDRLYSDRQGHHAENERRCEPAQVPDLSGTKAVTLARGVALCVAVSRRRDTQCTGMGRHVEAIGK
ncbi:hypothetical protein D3C81_1760370 [compost metagenome]